MAEWGAVDTAGWERKRRKMLEDSMRYCANHLQQMDYKRYQDMGVADRFGRDRGGMQNRGQAALVPFGEALERGRRTNDPEFARLAADADALGPVLVQA